MGRMTGTIVDKGKNGRRGYLRRLVVVLLLSALLSGTDLFAQGAAARNVSGGEDRKLAVDPVKQESGWSAVLYDNTNGLPTSEANAIAETKDGFIWIGSYSGLVRYDGSSFERVYSTNGITSVNCLYVDSQDRLWVGTNESGAAMIKPGTLLRWGEQDGLKGSSVRAIVEDKNGMIYIATTGGISIIDQDMKINEPDEPRLRDVFIEDLRVSNDGVIYGLTNTDDIFSVENGVLTAYLSNEDNPAAGIGSIFPDPNIPGYLYFETGGSEVCFGSLQDNLKDTTYFDISPLSQVECFEWINGKLWFCTRNGVGVLDNEGVHRLQDLPMDSNIGSMMTDYEGNLWFTSTRQGVMKIVPNQFTDINARYGLPEAVVNTTCMYEDRLFIGTDKGLMVLDGNGPVDSVPLTRAETASGVDLGTDDLLKLLNGCRIRSIVRDSRGRLWISTWREYGVIRYDRGEITAFTQKDGLMSDRVRIVYERQDGTMLVANTGGVSIIDGDRIVGQYGEKDGIENTEILSVAEGFNGDIVIGSDGGGIYVVGGDGIKHIGMKEGLTSEAVMRIKRDPKREIFWIVTGNSIGYLTSDYQLTVLDRFPYSNNFDLYENSQGEMWILSSNGIYVSPTEELLANETIRPIHFGMSNGLPCIATANSYSELAENGDLYISGSKGVAKINIEKPFDTALDLKMSVPYLEADGVRLYPDEEGNFTIGPKVQKLLINGYVFNYSLTDPYISYCLEGFDKSYVTVSRSDFDPAIYTNLPGGTYHFRMRIHGGAGQDSGELSVRIVKTKALHEQAWFYFLTGLAAVVCITAGVRLYMRRKIAELEKKHREEEEKEKVRTEMQMASQIQNSMLPHKFPPYPDRTEFDIYASMDPAKEVGGDFYDFFFIDDDHLCLIIADVSGKGIPAALFMMTAKAIVENCALTGKSASEILTKTNESLCSDRQIDMFVTVWLGILELSTGRLTAANAGHEFPVLKRTGGRFELYKDSHGFVVGGMEGMKYREYVLELEPGTKLFVYTDGVPEAANEEEKMFGTDRLIVALNEEPEAGPEKILANVQKAVDDFVNGAEQFDDLTMMCIEYKGQRK